MTDQNTTPVSEAPGDGSALRVIVVGAPGSGRSSLLGALGQVTRSQGRLVDGQLKTLSQGLAELADGISHADALLLTIDASAD
jgi:predicted AAA+ superfamily ATPase